MLFEVSVFSRQHESPHIEIMSLVVRLYSSKVAHPGGLSIKQPRPAPSRNVCSVFVALIASTFIIVRPAASVFLTRSLTYRFREVSRSGIFEIRCTLHALFERHPTFQIARLRVACFRDFGHFTAAIAWKFSTSCAVQTQS